MGCPFSGGIGRDSEMHRASAVMAQDYENKQQAEGDRGNDEEVGRNETLRVILQKSPPVLRWRHSSADHVLRDSRLRDFDPELQ